MAKEKLVIILILLVAFLLRTVNLSNVPPALNWDEVSHGYNAFAILKTGHDEWGQFLPITNFRAYGDYPLPFYTYLIIPEILLFGLNEFSVRLPSAIFGLLLVLVVYLFSKRISNNKYIPLVTALLVAISPWGILTSRQALQATPSVLLLTLGIYLFILGIEKKRIFLYMGISCLGLSAYAYHNTRILSPIIFVSLLIIFRKELLRIKKQILLGIIIAAVFFIPIVPVLVSSEGTARAAWVGILDSGAINDINQSRFNSTLPDPIPKYLYNKITYFSVKALQNYAGYFSPKFLGFEGGTQYQFSVPHIGIIYPTELIFFYVGLVLLLFKFKNLTKTEKVIFTWLFLAPIPAAITRDSYQVVRALVMMPAIYLVAGFGLDSVLNLGKVKLFVKQIIFCLLLVEILFLGNYVNNLWFVYPHDYSFAWQYGYKDVTQYIQDYGNSYDTIFITKKYGEPHEFLLFYTKYEPISYRQDPNLIRYGRSNWFWVDRFSKYVFLNDWEVKMNARCIKQSEKCLLITSPGNYPEGSELLKTVNFLDGKPAFDIVNLSKVQ